jgi:hypothetical protein
MESGDRKVALWHLGLGAISILNIVLWLASHGAAADVYGARQWALAGIFTAVCAFRSFLPRVDLERFVLVDHPLSSVFIGRSAATVAEVSFAVQCALALNLIGAQAGLPAVQLASYFVVPLLTLAQVFCWYSVVTLNHGGHAIEQSLWTFTHGAMGVCLAFCFPRVHGPLKLFVGVGIVAAAVFVFFMTTTDVPMYIRRWRQGRAEGTTYLPVGRGISDAWSRRVVTRSWADWKEELAWMTMYFSAAVWISLATLHLPR